MAAYVSVTNSVTATDQNQVNQYAIGLNNTLGLTSNTQDDLGRLVMPSAASFVGTPSSFQVQFVTTLGVGGRLMIRHSNGQTVAYLPLRQQVRSNQLGADTTINSASMTDIISLTGVVLTGGKLRIYLAGGDGAMSAGLHVISGGGFSAVAFLRANVGGVDLSEITIGTLGTNTNYAAPGAAMWSGYQPAAGTYTIKIRGYTVNAACSLVFQRGTVLVVEEYGD